MNIYQGGAKNIPVTLRKPNGDPVDLTGITEIETCFLNEDGTSLGLSKTGNEITIVGNPILGKILIALSAVETGLLAPIEGATLEIALTYAGDPVKCFIYNAYSIIESKC